MSIPSLAPTIIRIVSVVDCTDLSGKELHKPVDVGIVVTSMMPWLAYWLGMPEMWV